MEHTERDIWQRLKELPNWVTYTVILMVTVLFWAMVLTQLK